MQEKWGKNAILYPFYYMGEEKKAVGIKKSGEKFGDLIYLAYLCSVQRDKGMDCTS